MEWISPPKTASKSDKFHKPRIFGLFSDFLDLLTTLTFLDFPISFTLFEVADARRKSVDSRALYDFDLHLESAGPGPYR